jgi:uncharacterized protein YhfF
VETEAHDGPHDQALDDALGAFWQESIFKARLNHMPTYFGPTPLEVVRPPAWSVGESAAEADRFVDGLLTGRVAAIAGSVTQYDDEEPRPEVGELGIVMGGDDRPRALVVVTEVQSSAYAAVGPETVVLSPGLEPDAELVVQRLRVLHSR